MTFLCYLLDTRKGSAADSRNDLAFENNPRTLTEANPDEIVLEAVMDPLQLAAIQSCVPALLRQSTTCE